MRKAPAREGGLVSGVTYTVRDVICSNCEAGYSTIEIPKGCRLGDKHCTNCDCKTLVRVRRPTLELWEGSPPLWSSERPQ